MGARIRIGYFLEDRGHEALLKAFVGRVAREKGFRSADRLDDVRSSTGGKSIQAYRSFLKYLRRVPGPFPFDLLIVASDGNCKGYVDKKRQLMSSAEKAVVQHLDRLVFAIPDPHIERWYMADPKAFNRAFGSGTLPVCPPYKCEKGHYKKAMQDAIATSTIRPQFGGYEYGEKIVEKMDLYAAAKADPSLKHFIDELRDAMERLRPGT